jgi:predicted GTPase
VGNSGCGKTTLLYNLIVNKWGIPFYYLYIFSKSLDQNMYRILKMEYDKLSAKKDTEIAHFFSSCEELISVEECKPNSLVVFDDCVNSQQQQTIKDYFVRGRHKDISCVYLTRSHTKTDRQLIRNNINFLCIFRQNQKYTKDIYDEYVGSDFTFEKFKEICDLCWSEDYGFLTIDTTKILNYGRYRNKFDEAFNA